MPLSANGRLAVKNNGGQKNYRQLEKPFQVVITQDSFIAEDEYFNGLHVYRLILPPPPCKVVPKNTHFAENGTLFGVGAPPPASFYYCIVDKSKSQAHFDNFDGFRENDKKMLKASMTARAMALDGGYRPSGNRR